MIHYSLSMLILSWEILVILTSLFKEVLIDSSNILSYKVMEFSNSLAKIFILSEYFIDDSFFNLGDNILLWYWLI